MRYTKIICTLGPTSNTAEQIEALARGGMNIARINLSHGTQEQHRNTIQLLHRLNERLSKEDNGPSCISILLDTQGAEIRTGDREQPLLVKAGDEVLFSPVAVPSAALPVVTVNYAHFARESKSAERILIDNGELSFDFVGIDDSGAVRASAREAGDIGSRRHVNLPGATLDLASITEKDWSDIKFAMEERVDFLALSFIRTAEDLNQVREFLQRKQSTIQLIAKIETREAVDHIEEIVNSADGIMVARGDLGAEVPFERVPVIQDELVALCREASKPVIVATHMLESMILQPMPTRAEVTDITHAASTRTDATMLSAETANGKHVLGALDAMHRVLLATEEHLAKLERFEDTGVRNNREARAEAAVTLADSTNADAVIVVTRSGKTARDICKYRPFLPIIAFTVTSENQRHLQLSYGIQPYVIPFDEEDPEATVRKAFQRAKQSGLVKSGDHVIVVADTKAEDDIVHSIQMRRIS